MDQDHGDALGLKAVGPLSSEPIQRCLCGRVASIGDVVHVVHLLDELADLLRRADGAHAARDVRERLLRRLRLEEERRERLGDDVGPDDVALEVLEQVRGAEVLDAALTEQDAGVDDDRVKHGGVLLKLCDSSLDLRGVVRLGAGSGQARERTVTEGSSSMSNLSTVRRPG